MPMHYPPLADGSYRVGDEPQPLPSPVPGPDASDPRPEVDAPAGPAPGPEEHAPEKPERKYPRDAIAAASIIGGLGLVVVIVLGWLALAPGSGRGPDAPGGPSLPLPIPGRSADAPFTVDGRFTVVSSPGEPVSGDATGCTLPVSLADIGGNSEITLVEGGRGPLAVSTLTYERGDTSSCTFTFEFADVPTGLPYYVVELDGRGQLNYTETELRAGVDITLGR